MVERIREIEKQENMGKGDNKRTVIIGLTGHDSPKI